MRGFERIVALERLKHLDLSRLVKFMRGAVSSELTDELVGGLPPANALLESSGPALRLLQCHFTGTDWLSPAARPAH
eukprot:643584-Prymnesium_polylepis.1